MPSVDELLNIAEVVAKGLTQTNDVIEIDADTRTMIIPDTERIFGVMSDEKGERKYFRCKRFVGNGIDLSKLDLRVIYQNASGLESGRDKYIVTDLATDGEDYVTFSWELSRKVTAYKGIISFIVCAIKTGTDGIITNEWNTTLANGIVLDGLEVSGTQEQEKEAYDYYKQLEEELEKKAQEVIGTIPSDYTQMQKDVSSLNENLRYFNTQNLINPVYKSGTVDGITYSFKNGRIHIIGKASGRKVLQIITGKVGEKYSISCLTTDKPPMYIVNNTEIVGTYLQAQYDFTFTMPATSVTLEFYVNGEFNYEFTLSLTKCEIPTFPMLIHEDGKNTVKSFADASYEAIGDSLTYGFTGSWSSTGEQNRINTPYVEQVKNILGLKKAINNGESGTTIGNDMDKMGTYYPISNDNRLNKYTYEKIISIMGGTNDYIKSVNLGTINDSTSKPTFHAGWKRIFNKLISGFYNYDPFIFVIIPPVTKGLNVKNSVGYTFNDYIEATKEECRKYGVPYLDMSIMGRLNEINKVRYTSDGIHFNQLYVTKIFAPIVAEFIKIWCN